MPEEKGGVPAAPSPEAPKFDIKEEAGKVAEPITGLTSRELSFGYWWLSHKLFFRKIAIGLLIVIDTTLVGYSVFAWGTYAVYGYWKERAMLADMTVSHIPFKKYREAHAPTPLATEGLEVFDSGTKAGWKDIVVSVSNQNERWLANLTYQFQDGEEITSETTATLLPGESAYLGILGYAASTTIRDPEFIEKNVAWQRVPVPDVASYIEGRLDFEIGEVAIVKPGTVKDLNVYQITFPITNHTSYSYWTVPLSILLYSGDTLVGIEQAQIDSFLAGEKRTIDVRSLTTSRAISRAEVVPRLNVFDEGVYKNE